MAGIYPWQTHQYAQVVAQIEMDRLPHALLLAGQAGLGKRDFAFSVAALLLCRSPQNAGPCHQCTGCRLLQAGNHPDLVVIEPEKPNSPIRIDEIRELIAWAGQTSQQGGYKVVVVYPADRININAGNALLKCLEEPRPNTLLILVCDRVSALLPTVRSRCQKLNFGQPDRELSLSWLSGNLADVADAESLLDFSQDRPLLAAACADGEFLAERDVLAEGLRRISQRQGVAVEVAAELAPYDAVELLDILLFWLHDLVRLSMTQDEKSIKNKDMGDLFKEISTNIEQRGLFEFIDEVTQERSAVLGPSNPNKQLLLEHVMIRWSELVRRVG
jgi:DNA polymerase-3 subunit delta'|tara:strand:- start:1344 stop:2336 length:993 start_codon:yes stop_codon:yes gene_type:complete